MKTVLLLWLPLMLSFKKGRASGLLPPDTLPVAALQQAKAGPTWETVLDGKSFSSYSAFEAAWNYLYPWGPDHNGTARMFGSATDHDHIYLNNGVLTIKATRISVDEGKSSSPPHLPIRYHSGAVHTKFHVLINDQFPNYEVKGNFQAPSVKGSWPAFWLTSVKSWPPESDIMEFKGNDTTWQNTFRTPSDVTSTLTRVPLPGNWHNYRVWITKVNATDVDIHYYIDDVWKGVHRGNFVGKPMHVIINMQMEGSSEEPGPNGDTYMAARDIYIGRTRNY